MVREQLFAYILDTYHENDLTFDSYEKRKLASGLAYDGKWKPYFEYIAGCLHRYASQRDKQKGEYFVHGFTLAMTAQNPFYRPVSEKDSQEGYVDLFLHPLLDIYKDISHSYIIELKYAKGKDSSERIEQLRRQAIEQAERYASSESVQKARNIVFSLIDTVVYAFFIFSIIQTGINQPLLFSVLSAGVFNVMA